jgi:antiviral helicase SKI2
MLSFSVHHKTFIPEGIGGHAVISVKCQEIVYITKSSLKVETDKIIQNWDQRQIPRFRDAPPGQSVVKAVGDLNDLNNSVASGKQKLEYFQFGSDFKILDSYENLQALRSKLDAAIACTDISNFDKEFAAVYDRKQLEKKLNDLKFQLSNKNLSLYPDYCNKLEVLKALNYIDEQEQVAMKGRVACQMSQNELMITELVLRNILTDLNPAEIAALLSSLVFQAKSDNKPKLTETLKARVKQFVEVEEHITKVEQAFKVGLNDDSIAEQKLNFGLVEVVYEWARNKPFAEIMTLTDIKEGIIVRCITQLHETLRAVKDAARIIGDPTLHSKMEEASNAIKRDIVFAASLYTLKEDVMVGLE